MQRNTELLILQLATLLICLLTLVACLLGLLRFSICTIMTSALLRLVLICDMVLACSDLKQGFGSWPEIDVRSWGENTES